MRSPAGAVASVSEPASPGLTVRLRQAAPVPLDAALDCAPGELLALVGPSGSGKTTILRCIAGLNRPESGRIAVDGALWAALPEGRFVPPQRRRVGLVFQDYALFPHLSALANVALAAGHLPAGERAPRARRLLELVHLAGLEDRRPAQLSGGQRQRVALARALAREPAVLLLDEPFSAVDRVTRRKLQRELVLLRRAIRAPSVLVTHDLEEALALADRLCVLHHGTTLQTAPPYEVMTRPRTPQVARLVDQPNVFEARVVAHQGESGPTIIDWHGRRLEARHSPGFAVGAPVAWMVPVSHVLLHRRERPSRGERENPVPGRIAELLVLGETTTVTMQVDGAAGARLVFSLSSHAARRNGLALGQAITVSLLADGLHLMPPEPAGG